MHDGEAITVRVLDIRLGATVIQLPSGELDEMPLLSLPRGVQVRLIMDCEVKLLYRDGLLA